jgi:hypothetical protein
MSSGLIRRVGFFLINEGAAGACYKDRQRRCKEHAIKNVGVRGYLWLLGQLKDEFGLANVVDVRLNHGKKAGGAE